MQCGAALNQQPPVTALAPAEEMSPILLAAGALNVPLAQPENPQNAVTGQVLPSPMQE